MRRRVLIVVLGLLGLVVVVAATLPYWLGALTRSVGPRFGITYSDYTRIGYGRFALTNVVYRHAGVEATAERVELASPLVWASRRAGKGTDIRVGKWAITLPVANQKTETKPPQDPNAVGWVPLRQQLRDAVGKIEAWVTGATIGPGVIKTPSATVSLAGATWHDRTLTLQQVAFQDRVIDAQITLLNDADEIRLSATTKADDARLALTSRGAEVTGELVWWGEPARFTAQFPPQGWIPIRAELSATNWDFPAAKLQLGEHYATVHGNARIVWTVDRFAFDVTANSTALERENAPPPLNLVLRGKGDLNAATIEQLDVHIPGADAQLSGPVTVTRAGEIRDAPARFKTAIELAQLPWIEATGNISGQIEIGARPPGTAPPPVVFQLEANDVAAEGISLRSAVAHGRLEWPRLPTFEATIVGTNNEQLRARGGWDFKASEALGVTISGELRQETFARWLPKNLSFGPVRIDASASGPIAQLRHRGNVQVTQVKAANLKPLDVTLDWNGIGQGVEVLDLKVSAGESHLAVTGAANLESARLTAFEFAPRNEPPLRIVQPATLRWKPTLQIESLALASEKSRIDANVVWGETGSASLALRQIPSTWLTDFVTLPGPAWTISSVAVNGAWDRGPLTFEAIVGATAALQEKHEVTADLHLRGDADGVRLIALRALDNGVAVFSAAGRAPAIVTPAASPILRFEPRGDIELELAATDNKAVWDELGQLAGVTLESPRLSAQVAGTWREPKGELRGSVARVSFAPKADRALPPIERIELAITADRRGVAVERAALAVENQTVRASGRLPFPKDNWDDLRKDPLGYARRGAHFELEVPAAEIAAFKELLPPAIVPQGTVEANVTFRDGGLDGSLQLRNAATRPIGTLGALREIQADVKLEGQVIRLDSLSAELAGAPLRISGTATLPPRTATGGGAKGGTRELPKFDVAVKADNVPLVRKVGTLVRADIDVTLTSPPDAPPIVQGTVRMRDSLFLQDVRALLPTGTKSKTQRPPYFAVEIEPFSQWRLDVRVAGEEFMRLRTTLFNGTASADFRLGGTLGEPTLLGEAEIDRGKVRLPFATFVVEEGRVALTPAQPHEPEIFVTAATRRYEYDLRMEVSGNASSPQLTFESTPPLERAQVLLMVMAGVVPNNAGTVTQQQRARKLGAFLGQSLLSSFGDGDDTSRLTITSGADISEQGRETFDIEYQLNKRWSLTAETPDEYDTHTFGIKWQALTRGGTRLAGSGSESFDRSDSGGDGTSESGARAGGTRPTEGDPGQNKSSPSEPARGEKKPKPAKLDVSGLGFFGDFEMEASLKRLLGEERDVLLDSQAVEDALFLLLSAVREDGYLRPTVRVHALNDDGTRREFIADADLAAPMPRDLAARSVQFHVDRGTRYFVADIDITGLHAIDPDTARAYFVGGQGLLKRQKASTFTPGRLNSGVSSLEAALRERGYAEAKVTADEPRIDEQTGAVTLAIAVTEGPQWQIAGIEVEGAIEGVATTERLARRIGEPWSESVEQDIAAEVRRHHLEQGYADARVRVSHRTQPADPNHKVVGITARVEPGPRVTIGAIRFDGNVRTRDKVLRRRVAFEPGDPLNLLAVQRARHRISRLGVFDDVDVQFEPLDGAVRDVVFDVKPGRRLQLHLLAGYNTYEQFRVGVDVRHFNVWGRAHQTRGLFVQSMKSTRGEYSYTVPELFGENVHGTARVFGLQREEVAFLRQEYGTRFNIDTPLRFLDANLTAGYTFEVLRNRDSELETRAIDHSQLEVASIEVGLTRDRRDNPLLPRDGYRWFGRIETASEVLGGRAEYQRLELGGTYHLPWGTGRWWHFGASHGVVTTLGRNDEQLPVNKRFFPGGDGSIRGYQLGEAAPRAADGRFVGAKSYVNGSVEFEQALADKWSGVLFVDALGSARSLGQYPFDEVLVSVGLGIRYQTLIGPIRAEYGYNLNPRELDPRGTFLLSIGFPF